MDSSSNNQPQPQPQPQHPYPCTSTSSFFRCPISLEVMQSPVCLPTGITYDLSSIQPWLLSGHSTCPSTNLPLPSPLLLLPNLTLLRLSQSSRPGPESESNLHSLLHRLFSCDFRSSADNLRCLTDILRLASLSPQHPPLLASNPDFLNLLLLVLNSDPNPELDPDVLEACLKIFHLISPKLTALTILNTHPNFLSSLARILHSGRPDSLRAIAGILRIIAPDPGSKKAVLDNPNLLPQLLRLLNSTPAMVAESLLSTLLFLCSPRTNKVKLVRAGTVRVLTHMIRTIDSDTTLIELALALLESLAGSAEGRAAISGDPDCIPAIVGKLMKVSREGKEHGVGVLWCLCYLFRDQKAKEGVSRCHGGLTKILLLMQSDCSPAVKHMCSDLLRIFRLNSKSCLSSYDSRTTHIMPC